MQYFLFNQKTEEQIASIKRAILLSMNGITASSMEQAGLLYKKNFGVSIPRIKEIANQYHSSTLLAQRLWELKIRESMILATLLHPAETFTIELSEKWINDATTSELQEQLSINLLQKTKYSAQEIKYWISDNKSKRICALLTGSRIVKKIPDKDIPLILNAIIRLIPNSDMIEGRAISIFLRSICRNNEKYTSDVIHLTSNFINTDNRIAQYIYEEIKTETDYR